jgi:hypothetical protein
MANSNTKKVRIYVGSVGSVFAEYIAAQKDLNHAKQNISDWNDIISIARVLRAKADIYLNNANDALSFAELISESLQEKMDSLDRRSDEYKNLSDLKLRLLDNDKDDNPYNGGSIITAEANVSNVEALIDELELILKENYEDGDESAYAYLAEAEKVKTDAEDEVNRLLQLFMQMIPEEEISPYDQSDIDEQKFRQHLKEIEEALKAAGIISDAINDVSEAVIKEYERIMNGGLPLVYTEKIANAYNATLPGAVHAGDVKTPAQEAQDAIEPVNAVYSFVSYGDAEATTQYGEGTVEVIEPREDGATVKVLTNEALDENAADFVGQEFNVNSLDESATLQLFSTDGLALPIYVKVTKKSDAVEGQPAIGAQDAVLYTEETAAEYNATLDGAVHIGDEFKGFVYSNTEEPETPEESEVYKYYVGKDDPQNAADDAWKTLPDIPNELLIDEYGGDTGTWYVAIPRSFNFNVYDSTGTSIDDSWTISYITKDNVEYTVFVKENIGGPAAMFKA